jgi:hypothetical protein
MVTVLSIDLACRSYADIGVCLLRSDGRSVEAIPFRLPKLGLSGKPHPLTLAVVSAELAERHQVRLVLIDGPQAWKHPDNGLDHARICERALATQGKTGLPGTTKPSTFLPFSLFSIALFNQLGEMGWPRLPATSALYGAKRFALESYPTSAWRSLGLKPLPSKTKATDWLIHSKLTALRRMVPLLLRGAGTLSHDELQAIVSGLAGIAAEGYGNLGVKLVGIPPVQYEGVWREGYIAIPTRKAEAVG